MLPVQQNVRTMNSTPLSWWLLLPRWVKSRTCVGFRRSLNLKKFHVSLFERTASQIKAEPVPEVHQAYRNCFERMKKELIANYGKDYTSKLPQKMTRK